MLLTKKSMEIELKSECNELNKLYQKKARCQSRDIDHLIDCHFLLLVSFASCLKTHDKS